MNDVNQDDGLEAVVCGVDVFHHSKGVTPSTSIRAGEALELDHDQAEALTKCCISGWLLHTEPNRKGIDALGDPVRDEAKETRSMGTHASLCITPFR